ncbi:AgmX/PglI C-terminal domain-containing protein [Bdellovibrio sp. HCB337]|uniref:AgmX/PglI C-terminal domain-containing protein n=1 Tax=Bdellovibrio sp. HCB337 TaxID=3394358 RepID=UPI0039A76B60
MKKYTEDPRITAYALGELHGAEAEEVKRLVAQDPELQRYVEEIQGTANSLSVLFKQEELVPLKPAQREKLEELTKPRWSFKAVWGGLGATLAVAGLAFVISTQEMEVPEPEAKNEVIAQVVFDKKAPSVDQSGSKKTRVAEDVQIGYAAEEKIEEKPKQVAKSKKFTSVKQGGSLKQEETTVANAQNANKDANKVGMLSAFGGGGMRKNLDKAYSGSGDLVAGGKSTDGAGDDIGSKFKDTAAGGKGTATQGIAGVGTKGRGVGYGAGNSLGAGGTLTIDLGGAEEHFEGTIDREAVRRVIRAGLGEIRGCYEREAKKLSESQRLEGKVIIALKINGHGRAVSSIVQSSTTGNSDFDNCVKTRFSTWRFPDAPEGSAIVHYPVYLRIEN